jgi:rhomboid-like protein
MKKYQDKALITKDTVAPAQAKWKRLLPSAIVTALVVLFSISVASNYHPPSKAARLWPDMPPAAATVLGIIIANSIVLVAWRIPMAWGFLNRYFLSVPGYPFALSMIGNIFSHQQPSHLAMNMAVLWIVGTKCT